MTEILTESFCERCGTRYTFESAAPKRGRLGKVRTLSKGLKNYVLSDETTLSEAMADARSDDSQSASAEHLDAFHKTFNFCMSCRQYTCSNCWNEVEGRCLSCAPHLGHEVLPAPFPDLDPSGGFAMAIGAPPAESDAPANGHPAEDLAWPEIDLPSSRIARALGEETNGSTPEAVAEPIELIGDSEGPGAVPPVELQPDAMDAFAAAVEAASEPIAEAEALVEAEAVEPEPVVADAVEVLADAEVADAEPAHVEPREDAPVPDADLPPAIRPRIVPRSAAAIPSSGAPSVDRVAAAAAQTNALLAKFRPGQSLDEAIAAYEAEVAKARGVDPSAIDLPAPTSRREPVATPEPIEPAPVAAEPVAAEPVAAAPVAAPEPEPEPVAAEAAPEPVAAVPEPEPIAAAPEPEPEPVVAAPEPEPEPLVADAEPQPEPAAATVPVAPEPQAPAPEPRRDVVEQPAWRIVAPDTTPEQPAAPWATQPPAPANGQPQWPAASADGEPQWPATPTYLPGRPGPAVGTLGGRTIVRSSDAMWAASNQEVLAKPPTTGGAIAPCRNCGLSLSANARFCRRCGSRQA